MFRHVDSAITWTIERLAGSIARAASAALSLRLINLALGLTTTVILGRALGAEGFGVYAVGLATAAIIAGLSQSGVAPQILKASAAARQTKDWGALNGVRRISFVTPILVALVIAVPATLVIAGSANGQFSPFWRAAALGAVIAPFALADACASSLLRGIGRVAIAFAPRFVIMQSVYLILVLILVGTGALTPMSALLCFLASWTFAIATSWAWIIAAWPAAARGHRASADYLHWRRAIFFTMIASLGAVLFGNVETFILSRFSSPAEVGVYAMAFRFAQFVSFPIFALSSGLAPVATAAVSDDRLETAQRKTITAARIATFAAAAAALSLALAGIYIFPAIHADFGGAYVVMNIISAGLVFQAMLGYPLIFIVIYGFERTASLYGVVITVAGLGFITLLTAFFGAVGAAIAGSIASALLFLSRWAVLYRFTGIRNDIFASAAGRRKAIISDAGVGA